MAAAATVSIIMLLLLALVLIGLVTGIVLWITGGRRRGVSGGAGPNEMACGQCGYAVRGLQQLNCPECGADLRVVGIGNVGSGGKRTVGIVLTVVCGLLLLSCLGFTGVSWMTMGVNQSVSSPAPVRAYPAPQTAPATPPANAPEAEADEDGAVEPTPDGE